MGGAMTHADGRHVFTHVAPELNQMMTMMHDSWDFFQQHGAGGRGGESPGRAAAAEVQAATLAALAEERLAAAERERQREREREREQESQRGMFQQLQQVALSLAAARQGGAGDRAEEKKRKKQKRKKRRKERRRRKRLKATTGWEATLVHSKHSDSSSSSSATSETDDSN